MNIKLLFAVRTHWNCTKHSLCCLTECFCCDMLLHVFYRTFFRYVENHIRRCGSIPFRDGKGNFEFTIVMYYPDNAKESTNPKPSMQLEWYCLAVHKWTCECTLEYAGVEKRIAEKSDSFFFFLIQNSWLAHTCQPSHNFWDRLGNWPRIPLSQKRSKLSRKSFKWQAHNIILLSTSLTVTEC